MRSSAPATAASHLVALLVATAAAADAVVPPPSPPAAAGCRLEATYLANEGVVVAGAGAAVLFDGLFAAGIPPYPRLTADTAHALATAAAPFDAVEWVLVSHRHADHFDAAAVAAHLRANGRARLASTRAVVDAVRELLPAADGARLVAVAPTPGSPVRVAAEDGLQVEAHAVSHGEGHTVENLGFVVTVDGLTVLHLGDSEATAAELERAIGDRHVDLALVPFWYALDASRAGAIATLGAQRTALMHLPERSYDEGFVAEHGGWGAVLAQLAAHAPAATVLDEPGERLCLSGRASTAPAAQGDGGAAPAAGAGSSSSSGRSSDSTSGSARARRLANRR